MSDSERLWYEAHIHRDDGTAIPVDLTAPAARVPGPGRVHVHFADEDHGPAPLGHRGLVRGTLMDITRRAGLIPTTRPPASQTAQADLPGAGLRTAPEPWTHRTAWVASIGEYEALDISPLVAMTTLASKLYAQLITERERSGNGGA